jgi:hypothetical protein
MDAILDAVNAAYCFGNSLLHRNMTAISLRGDT